MIVPLLLQNLIPIQHLPDVAHRNLALRHITDEGAVVIDKTSKIEEIRCNTVALALGLKSEDQLYNLLRGNIPQLYAIGDCKEPRRILEAIWDAYSVASVI